MPSGTSTRRKHWILWIQPGYLLLTWVQLRRGHAAEAERAARRLLEISPTFTYAHFILGEVLLAGHRVQDALVEMLKETDDASRLGGSAMAYFALARASRQSLLFQHSRAIHSTRRS
jgi:predicted Zn-dependent protease